MRKEIQNITVTHPELGELQKKVVVTFDDNDNEILREGYIEPPKINLIEVLANATQEEINFIKQLLV